MFRKNTCFVGQITGLYALSETSARGPNRDRGLFQSGVAAAAPLRSVFRNSLTCRANHRLISIIARIELAPGKLAAGFFIFKFSNRTAVRIHGARIIPCRCIDARGVLSRRRPNHLEDWPACANTPAAARQKSAAARGPARDKVRAPNDRAWCRSCRIFILLLDEARSKFKCQNHSPKSAQLRAAIPAPRSMSSSA